MKELNNIDEELELSEYAAEKLEIIKDSLARLSFFDFLINDKAYRVDAFRKTICKLHRGTSGEQVCTFKNFKDLMSLTYFENTPFKELVISDDFRITAF